MLLLIETLLFYARVVLLIPLALGTIVHWQRPKERCPFLYTLGAMLTLYLCDGLWMLGVFAPMEERMYARVRQLVAVTSLSLSYWALLVASIDRHQRRWKKRTH
jgi:hypothetical protein